MIGRGSKSVQEYSVFVGRFLRDIPVWDGGTEAVERPLPGYYRELGVRIVIIFSRPAFLNCFSFAR